MKKVLITTGGTGGHIFPAIALADDLKKLISCAIVFAGGNLSKNAYFESQAYPVYDITTAPMSKNPWRLLKGAYAYLQGFKESRRILKKFDPDVVVGFGSYYAFPMLLAALSLKIPVLLHEANSIPGRVNRILSPFAKHSWTYFPLAKDLLKGSVKECKMPLRSHLKKGLISKKEAFEYFNLKKDLPVILIFGGSQGAQGINILFNEENLSLMKKNLPPFQVIHFTGTSEKALALDKLYSSFEIPNCVKPFENKIDFAWVAADFAITRSGASSIAEQCEYEVPGIHIPYPYAMDDHQKFNAEYVEKIGLGVKILEKDEAFVKKMTAHFNNRENAKSQFLNYKIQNQKNDFSKEIIEWHQKYKKK